MPHPQNYGECSDQKLSKNRVQKKPTFITMGICMAAEVRRELKQIEEIYHKTCELKQCKRVLVVGAPQCGKTELINQAISTNTSCSINEPYLDFQYEMGPFIINENAKPKYSLSTWEYKNDIISWENTLSYYPPIYEQDDEYEREPLKYHNTFDFESLLNGFCREYGSMIFIPNIRDIITEYFPRPNINCFKDEIIDDNLIEFWEISEFDYSFWAYCCKQIIGIIYVVDISCYNDFYYDPLNYTKTKNKMTKIINRFKEMTQNTNLSNLSNLSKDCNNNIAFYVFFNKLDIFKQKIIKGISIKTCPDFKGYEGDEYNYNECINYIKSTFDAVNDGNDRLLYFNETCAIHKGDVNTLNLLGTINDNMNAENIKNIWHKFGANLSYHWNELKQ